MPAVENRLPREMTSRLASVRVRIRAVELALAGERALLAVIAAVVLSFVLDTTLEPDLGVRRPFTLFLLASALLAGGGFVALAFKRRLTDDAVAILIEQVYPELEDGLVSSVQLARDLERGGLGHTSPALIRSVISRTSHKARGLDFGRVVDPSPLLPATFLTLAAVFGLAIFSLNRNTGPLANAWFERCVLGREVQYPKAIALEVTVPGAKDGVLAVARGDDVPVEIFIKKGARRVDSVRVRTWPLKKDETSGRYSIRGRYEETRLQQVGPTADAKYRKIYQNVVEAFEFEVFAGSNVRSGRFRVVVVDRPRVEEARFWLTYPEYVGLVSTPPDKPETQPDLRVPVGTEIRYEVIANKPLALAKLVFETDDPSVRPTPGQPQPEPKKEYGEAPAIGGKDKLDRRVLTGKFHVMKSVRFRYELRSLDDYTDGPKPVVFNVMAVIDKPPEVKILVPGRPKQVTPRAIVPLEVDFKDEYGLVKAELRLWPEIQNTPPSKDFSFKELPFPPDTQRTALVKYRLDLAEYGLHPGDKVTYKAVAWDNDILVPEDKRVGESASYLLQVVSPEDLARMLQDRLQRVKDDLIATAKVQHQAREDTDKLVRSLVAKTKLDEPDKKDLLLADYEQRKVTSRLATAGQELDRLVEERELNRLGDDQELDRERMVGDKTRELAQNMSPSISKDFDEVRGATLDERTKARLAQIPDVQEKLETAILLVAEMIDRWANFADVIREFRDIMNAHQRAQDATTELLKGDKPEKRDR